MATYTIIDLEMLYSARNAADHAMAASERFRLPSVDVDRSVTDRALAIQALLAQRGQHRLPIPDLLIVTAAEVNGLVVLHYDAGFDRIADLTGQQTEWIVPKCSVPDGIVRWRPNSGRLLEHQAQGDSGKGEHQGRHDRDAVQVLLDHGRACGLGTDTPTEHVGEATTLTAVEEDQEDDSQT